MSGFLLGAPSAGHSGNDLRWPKQARAGTWTHNIKVGSMSHENVSSSDQSARHLYKFSSRVAEQLPFLPKPSHLSVEIYTNNTAVLLKWSVQRETQISQYPIILWSKNVHERTVQCFSLFCLWIDKTDVWATAKRVSLKNVLPRHFIDFCLNAVTKKDTRTTCALNREKEN